MGKKILIIGGAGFIGSHLVDELLVKGYEVTVYDNLDHQVHGKIQKPPEYLSKDIEFIKADIRNRENLLSALEDIDIIYHLAAKVGIGQSMYQIDSYIDVNTHGTAILLDILVNERNNVKKLVIASSNSTYGEGRYFCANCGKINPKIRSLAQFEARDWDLNCHICGEKVKPIPTDEEKPQDCKSIYALSKLDQEKMCLLIGETYGINTTALRFFNVYGSRQALSNPYTGVCAIFSTSLLCGNSPLIYEDGNQSRDFVHVKDICQALILSIEKPQSKNEIFNVGTGKPTTIKEVAIILGKFINPDIVPQITNQYRPGDVRHCFADISRISSKLGYKPKYSFEKGMGELIEWVKSQQGKVNDKISLANQELKQKGLLK
ncbi:MAG: SDR family NAD(P)-dependent oxidoreductase [Promethearchaeota archaeon]